MFAQDLGIPADAITPLPLVLLMVPAVILITNTVAFWPARTAARLKPKAMKLRGWPWRQEAAGCGRQGRFSVGVLECPGQGFGERDGSGQQCPIEVAGFVLA